MLIPQFKLQQQDEFIIVSIRVPYIKVTAAEFYIEQKTFKFYLKPYLLSLSFEQPLQEAQEPAKAIYNYDKHILTVYLQKKNKKQFFEGLNMLSNILNNKKSEINHGKKQKKNLIEVINETGPKVIQTEAKKQNSEQFNYGFCGNYDKVFNNLSQEVAELFSFNPKDVAIDQRFEFEKKIAFQQFDQNSYLFDKLSNFQQIDRIVESTHVETQIMKMAKQNKSQGTLDFQKFKSQFKIPNKQIMVPKDQHVNIWKQLFAICFSYIYEMLCMQGQMGVQSARTLNKTCSVFTANILYRKQSLLEVIYDCCRRCVTYSLYKHLDICQKVINIMRKNLCLDLIIAILTDVRSMFQKSQPRYLLNTIYLNDYCIYLMTGLYEDKEASIKNLLLKHIMKLTLVEDQFGLDIPNEEMGSMMENESQFVDSGFVQSGQESDDLQKMLDLD